MKKLLHRCWKEREKLQMLLQKSEMLHARACSPSGICYSDTPRERGERIPAALAYVEQKEELSKEIEAQKAILSNIQIQAERAFSELPENQKALMTYRYIKGLEWKQIQDKMGIDSDQSKKLHYAAKNKLFPKKT